MNHILNQSVRQSFRLGLLCLLALSFGLPARAGLQIDMHLYGGYYCFPWISTNSTPPSPTNTAYFVWSPTSTINSGIHFQLNPDNTIAGSSSSWISDYQAFIHEITNGNWTLLVTNATSTNQYTFKVTVPPTITSNLFAPVNITSPTDGQINVANTPTFTWTGPVGWAGSLEVWDNSVDNNGNHTTVTSANLTPDQTLWTSPVTLPDGTNSFTAKYTSNATAVVTVSTPVDSLSQPFPGFSFISTLETYSDRTFSVGIPVSPTTFVHTNVAHYTFDDSGNLGLDSSGNGNDMPGPTWWGPTHEFDTDAEAGGGAAKFFGTSCMTAEGQTLINLNAVLAGSFTFSAWVKTTVTNGLDYNNAFFGAAIFWAYNDHGNTNDTIPLSITGSKAAFSTRGENPGAFDNLHSTTSVNDGSYHLITVTRNQATGEKKMYVDGNFETSETGTTNPLNGNNYLLTIGGWPYILESNSTVTNYSSYKGLLDDVQVYSGVLSDAEVASLYGNPGTTIPDIGNSVNGAVVHYDFDEGTELAADVSGNGNNVVYAGNFGGSSPSISLDTIAGAGSVSFDGGSYLTASPNLLSTLAGEFTVSLWLKTSQSYGSQGDLAWMGAGVISADSPNYGAKDLIPVALTGGQVAFGIGDGSSDNTLNSSATVNDDMWHHVVVTRNLTTGERQIFIDGTLDSSDTAATVLLDSPVLLTIGAKSDASDSDPASPDWNGSNGYEGLVDDIQMYNWVLSASEVAELFANPGTTVTQDLTADFNSALGTSGWTWTTSGDSSWFVQTTNTHDGVSAAQSGSVTGSQSSTLSTTVTGPGTLTFYWSSLAEDPNGGFFYEFYIDGNYVYDIYGDWSWSQDGSHAIPAGQHTLSWTVYAGGDTDPNQAGFLDQVTFIPDLTPIITLNPFNQTNYPGYNVALQAAATNSSSITWQWFKVGNASPIPNATNALFIPTNSGTAGVAGSYYAVASSPGGSTPTTAALVSFVSAPPPPDWARALKSPFGPVDGSVFNKDYYLGCAVDSAGDIYVAAQYFGNMNVRTNGNVANILTAPGSYGTALVKHSANGNALWAVGLTNNQTGNSYGMTVAVAPGNGAYLASQISGTNWLGTNRFVDAGASSLLLSRFDSGGSNIWSKLIGGTNSVHTSYNLLVSDDSGNVTLAGSMSGTVSFGGTNLSAPAGGGFIVQYDANGAVRWAQTVPVYTSSLASGSGLLYVSLQSTVSDGVTNVSIGSLSNVTDRAWAVACLNAADGQPLWLRGVGHQYGANSAGLTIDGPLISVSGSNVFLTANTFGSSVVFGGLSVPLPGGRGQYFARYDTNGTPWAATVFGSPTTMLWASSANASGVYVSGDFDSYSQFGNLVIAAPLFTTNDLTFTIGDFSYIYFTQPLIAKFDLNGNPLWARNGVSSAFANFRGIAATSDGVWASGFLKVKDISSPAQFGTNFVSSDLYVPGGGGPSPIIFTQAGMIAKIAESAAPASPLTLLNPQTVGTNFQFQFVSQTGFNHSILYRTNLVAGNWRTNSTIAGDGALKTITVPLSLFSPSAHGFVRVSTQ